MPRIVAVWTVTKSAMGSEKAKAMSKMATPYLGWAYMEAAQFALRFHPSAQRFYQRKLAKSNNNTTLARTDGLPPDCGVLRRLCREPCKSWTHEGARISVRCTRLDTAGNRGFSGARSVPGADVWLESETSMSLEPDG